jgi:crotonobetainyl-CoA:carnitine CoA-transferase CaiB-like acyl-CoA transferase
MGVLDGIRVLDFGRYIAGPYCGALLRDLGADVIRIEKIGGSEDRFVGPVTPAGDGAMFLQCNRGKRAMTLDPMTPAGREVVQRLVDTADVVIANLPAQTLVAMGLDYETLSRRREGLIVATVDAFGPVGPWAERLGFDAVGQAMSGAMYLSGSPGSPTKAAVNYVDFVTAISAAAGVLAALLARGATGKGQRVEASLLRSALTVGSPHLVEQAVAAPNRVASGNRSQVSGPSDAVRTRDGWLLVQVVGQPLFRRWARAIDATDLLTDPRFATDADRGRHGALLSERLQAWCQDRTTEEALAAFERAGVPAGPVLSPAEALTHPQVLASGALVPTPLPGGDGSAPLVGTPFGLGATPAAVQGPRPGLGEHTDAILQELGYTPETIAELRRDGVV